MTTTTDTPQPNATTWHDPDCAVCGWPGLAVIRPDGRHVVHGEDVVCDLTGGA